MQCKLGKRLEMACGKSGHQCCLVAGKRSSATVMPIVARTERLALRTWKRGDGKRYNELCNTPEVMRYLGGVQSVQALREDVAWFQDCFETYGHTLWAVERLTDGEFLGFAGLDKLLRSSGM